MEVGVGIQDELEEDDEEGPEIAFVEERNLETGIR